MTWPYPLRSKLNPSTPENLIDYSISSSLSASGSNYPCKGYQHDPNQASSALYTPGSTYNVTLSGSAIHGGGSCQLSLSYDHGQTFRVIKSMIGGCPYKPSYDFTIPSYAPTGEALFAWSWQNKIGNREFYMDCAVVQIAGEAGGQRKRQSLFDSMDSLPGIWKADLQSITSCTTTEGENPVYPNPGPDVEYGDGMNSSSPPSPGECDTISDGSANTTSASGSYVAGDPSGTPPAGEEPAPYAPTNEDQMAHAHPNQVDDSSQSTISAPAMGCVASPDPTRSTTVYVDCQETITMTIYPDETPSPSSPPIYTTSAPPSACTGTSTACPCAPGYGCRAIGTCTWACLAQGIQTTPTGFLTTTTPTPKPTITTTETLSPPTSTPTQQPPTPNPNQNRPPYANPSNLQSYLPCLPGSFICTSATQWYTCDHDAYVSPRTVADEMECLPFLAPSTGSSAVAQQNNVPQGYHRDDRYVRARPDGDCATDGAILCMSGGAEFAVCDQGGWVRMGAVAAGTVCRGGGIVGA